MNKLTLPGGVWSATPTPFTSDYRIDVPSVRRLVAHHLEMGVSGLLLAGTCGEGPWMRDCDLEMLTRTAVEAAAGRLRLALQVTANSIPRVLDNIEQAAKWGAEVVAVAAPFFVGIRSLSPERALDHYRTVSRRSPLPVCFYDFGDRRNHPVPESHLPELLSEANIAMVKDSSRSDSRRDIFLAARSQRPQLKLFTGSEFIGASYIQAGYDGMMVGGGIFNARLAIEIIEAVKAGEIAEAERIQARMNGLMNIVYGGPKQEYWLAGVKELLVRMGVFSTQANLLGYSLPDAGRMQILGALNGTDALGYRTYLLGANPTAAQVTR